MYGTCLGRASALFCANVAARHTESVRTYCSQVNVHVLEMTLDRTTNIMAEVETISTVEGIDNGDTLEMITDVHDAVLDADEMLGRVRAW